MELSQYLDSIDDRIQNVRDINRDYLIKWSDECNRALDKDLDNASLEFTVKALEDCTVKVEELADSLRELKRSIKFPEEFGEEVLEDN